MSYAINVKTNDEVKTVIIDAKQPNESVRAEIQSIVDFSLPIEREKGIKEFINEVNIALKKCACEFIVEHYTEDMVSGVLQRIAYSEFRYNASKNTLEFFEIAQRDKAPIFVEVNDVKRFIREFNKGKNDNEKLHFTGEFTKKVWALSVIAYHAIMGNLTEKDFEKIAEIAENKTEIFKNNSHMLETFKGFCKLSADAETSKTAQQEIINFFYSALNEKTGFKVRAVKEFKYMNEKNEEQSITVFKFIEGALRKVNSKTKTIKERGDEEFFNVLCNMYVTSEQALNVNSKGAKIDDAFATLNPVDKSKAENPFSSLKEEYIAENMKEKG